MNVVVNIIMIILLFFFCIQLGLSPVLYCEDSTDERENEINPREQSQREREEDSCESRLCLLQKSRLGFGFNLGNAPNRPGTFISYVGGKNKN